MRVKIYNWGGHFNLGDDAMWHILNDKLIGEHVESEQDITVIGGGTLIAPKSEFIAHWDEKGILPEKTAMISVGVSSNWDGEFAEDLRRVPLIYTRDYFSWQRLADWGIESRLSVDLLCALWPPVASLERVGTMVNIMYAPESINPAHKRVVQEMKELYPTSRKDIEYFAMSRDEDIDTIPTARLYTDATELLKVMSTHNKVVATRLHAIVLAWMAGVPEIVPIFYDPKIMHFLERVSTTTPVSAHELINKHLEQLNTWIKTME